MGGVKKSKYFVDVIYGSPLTLSSRPSLRLGRDGKVNHGAGYRPPYQRDQTSENGAAGASRGRSRSIGGRTDSVPTSVGVTNTNRAGPGENNERGKVGQRCHILKAHNMII